MGKRCFDFRCPYLAMDGTCLFSEGELKEKCPLKEIKGHEEKDEWIGEHHVKERLKALGVLE